MSSGYPDGQKITQWIGAAIAEAQALALGAGAHTDGPFVLGSWASIIVSLKPTGGPVTVTITQQVAGAPASLALVESVIVPAGAVLFEAFVLFGDTVSVTFQGSAGGTLLDYAITPSNTTTNAQVLTNATIGVQHNDVLIAAEPTLDFVDGPTGLVQTIVDDGPGTRVKVTPTVPVSFTAPAFVIPNAGAYYLMRSDTTLRSGLWASGANDVYIGPYFDNAGVGDFYITSGALLVVDSTGTMMRVHRHPYGGDRHIESIVIATGPAGATATFTNAFAAAPAVACTPFNTVANPVSTGAPTTTNVVIYSSVGTTVQAVVEGAD
jgi:hypothetical protein